MPSVSFKHPKSNAKKADLGDLNIPDIKEKPKTVPNNVDEFVNSADVQAGETNPKEDQVKKTRKPRTKLQDNREIVSTKTVPCTQKEVEDLEEVCRHLGMPIAQVYRLGVITLKRQILESQNK